MTSCEVLLRKALHVFDKKERRWVGDRLVGTFIRGHVDFLARFIVKNSTIS